MVIAMLKRSLAFQHNISTMNTAAAEKSDTTGKLPPKKLDITATAKPTAAETEFAVLESIAGKIITERVTNGM